MARDTGDLGPGPGPGGGRGAGDVGGLAREDEVDSCLLGSDLDRLVF